MAKQKFERSKPHVKRPAPSGTSTRQDPRLTRAITKVLAEQGTNTAVRDFASIHNAPEERQRGHHDQHSARRVRDGGIATMRTSDCPGSTLDYIKNMITGAAQMDARICIWRRDGPMPCWRDILLARQVEVPVDRRCAEQADMVDDPELLELVEMEVRELLSKYEFPGDDIRSCKSRR